MLHALRRDRLVHDPVLGRHPVLAERPLPAAAHPDGDHRRPGEADHLFVGCAGELLRLEEVLARWVGLTLSTIECGKEFEKQPYSPLTL